VDESFRDRLSVTLIAVRRASLPAAAEEVRGNSASGEDFDTQFLTRTGTARPPSRFVPPAPAMPPEKMQQMMSRQGSGHGRARKNASKMRQTQLPLEIISKGRFDKSEPTIHQGEDLDVPTYIRRGMCLN
jgi:cell division protein FtsZ